LISILGEKILAAEAYQRGWDQNEKFRTYSEQMENEAIVEALFEKEISSQIQISEDELKRAFFQSQSELDIQVLSFKLRNMPGRQSSRSMQGKACTRLNENFRPTPLSLRILFCRSP